ncbi:MAG TPA: aminoglycoside phosphotransferase family protein [Xanthobacteraceae bacterium]
MDLRDQVLANVAAQGAVGVAWLDQLPELVRRLEDLWGLEVGQIFPNATEAYVAAAVTRDGEEVALKIPIAGLVKADRELRALAAADGRGYVRLLRHDATSGAMLLERLGPQLAELSLPIDEQIRIICAALEQAWMPRPSGLQLVTGAEKASALASYIKKVWSKLGKPCSEKAFAVALRFAEARRDAFDPATAVFAHGDAHAWNTLQDPNTLGYKFVDPEGLFIERAHDLSISMREWSAELLAGDPLALGRRRCALLSRLTGVEAEAIWQWGFIERLVNGLIYREIGPEENALEFLTVVEAWAEAEAA